jgi:16S rRNA C967 or C1407 C5-methylase (RsmB/RsmF family)
LTGDSSLLIAVDRSRRRLRSLRSHMQRMGFLNYIIILADSRRLPPRIVADKALLDAPSTGEGIIRRDPSRKASRGVEDLAQIHRLQYELAMAVASRIGRGGVMVYASCSLGPEEGELIIHKLVSERSDVVVDDPGVTAGSPALESFRGVEFDKSVRRCVRFWPHIQGTEGFFMCRLRVG